jgi:hypothetical protein
MKEKKTEEQMTLSPHFKLPVSHPPWLDLRLTKEAMDHLWNSSHYGDAKETLVGHISRSEYIEDKDNWFYENVLKRCAETIYLKERSDPPPVFELKMLWVNYQKQHEFNPPHMHLGCIYTFVVFMKIPTHWKEQHTLPWLKDVSKPCASDFQFLLGQGRGSIQEINFSLCPEDAGRMLVFPAWLNHQVFPFYECEEERITISGNIIQKSM